MNTTLNRTYDELLARQKALGEAIFGLGKPSADEAEQYRTAYLKFMRGEMVTNSLSAGRDGSGGFLVPDQFEQRIIVGLEAENVLRKISNVIKTRYDLKIPGVLTHGAASWVDEEGVIADSNEEFDQKVISAYKIATSLRVSDELLEDSVFDIEKYIADIFAARIGRLEEATFLTGDGIGKPNGLLNDAPVSVTTEESRIVGLDDIIELMHSVSFRYRENAVWLMNDRTCRELLKIKSGHAQNLWLPSLSGDIPDKLLGHPVIICKSMPDIAPGNRPVLFGNFSYYWIGDRGNRTMKRLGELYATNGQVGFLASQRVDAKLVQPEAIKVMQVKA